MKYIIYCTTCTVNGKIYIGVHKTENPNVFDKYLGNGIEVGYTIKHPKTPFQYAIKRYGYSKFKRSTLYVFNTEEEAYEKESEIVNIDFVKRKDNYNIKVGGKIEHKLSKSTIYKYDLEGNLIAEYDSVKNILNDSCNLTKSGILDALSHKIPLKGNYYLSGEFNIFSVIKKRELVYNISDRCISKYKDGKLIYTYTSIKKAAKENNISVTDIKKSMKNKECIWSYGYNEEYVENYYPVQTKIEQYDLNGNLIKIWDSLSSCMKEHPKVKLVLSGSRNQTHSFTFKIHKLKV